MSYKNMIAEFEQSLDGCERALRDSSRKLRFLSEVDSSYLGHRYSARIRELNEKLAEVEVEKDELERSFPNIGRPDLKSHAAGSRDRKAAHSEDNADLAEEHRTVNGGH